MAVLTLTRDLENSIQRIQTKQEIIEDAEKLFVLACPFLSVGINEVVFKGQPEASRTDEDREKAIYSRTVLTSVRTSIKYRGLASENLVDGASVESGGSPPSGTVLLRYDSEYDEVDGSSFSALASDKTLDKEQDNEQDKEQDNEQDKERDELIAEIAKKLRKIGDSYEIEGSDSARLAISMLLESNAVEKLASNLTYDRFEEAVAKAVVEGGDPGLQRLVAVLRLASALARKAANARAVQDISRFCLSYFTDNLTDWVESLGGWRGVSQLL